MEVSPKIPTPNLHLLNRLIVNQLSIVYLASNKFLKYHIGRQQWVDMSLYRRYKIGNILLLFQTIVVVNQLYT